MSEPVIPERWHIDSTPYGGYGTRFASRLKNNKGQFVSLVGDHMAERIAKVPELEDKVKDLENTIAKLEETVAVYRGQSRLIERISNELEQQEATIARLNQSIIFAEHKVDQHLQGQYNNPPYRALGAALSELRAALSKKEPKS